MKRSLGAGEWVRRALGVLVLCGVAAIALGLDTGLLTRVSLASTGGIEQKLINAVRPGTGAASPCGRPASHCRWKATMPSLGGATRWLNSAAADQRIAARQGGAGRFLDVLLHQLHPRAAVRARLGRQVQGPRPGGDRRARARIRLREGSGQRDEGGEGPGRRLSRRAGQRLRDLERLQQRVLARALFHRRARPDPPSPFRRRRLSGKRRRDPSAADRGGPEQPAGRLRQRRPPRRRGRRVERSHPLTGNLRGLRPRAKFRRRQGRA